MIPAEVSRHWQWGILHIVKRVLCVRRNIWRETKVPTVTCVNLNKLFNNSEPFWKPTEHLPACKPYLSWRVVSPARLGGSASECALWLVNHYANNCYYYMCMCPWKAVIDSERGESMEGNTEKREDTERSSGGKRGKREAATVREGIKRKEGMWRETGAGTVTNKSPSMTAFCWSISFSHNIMVCYCPLSVLSVPESILNEGQLHLAAIFQLSPRCHGNPVVSRWTCR